MAATMLVKLATEPTERSISPQMMTKVMPIAITDTIAVMRSTALAVASEAKWGAKTMK